jgi:hypothetical protein
MYKCDMTRIAYEGTSKESLSSKITPIETSNTEVGGDGSKMSIKSSSTREGMNGGDKQPRTILGVLIFKLAGKN